MAEKSFMEVEVYLNKEIEFYESKLKELRDILINNPPLLKEHREFLERKIERFDRKKEKNIKRLSKLKEEYNK